MGNSPEHWAEWEVDPSTRSSVHLWTKYLPINATVVGTGTPVPGTDLLIISRGTPSVNKVTNPSFETGSPPTGYTEITAGGLSRVLASGDGEISVPTFAANGIDGRAYVAKVTATGNSADGSNGFYWTTGNEAGHSQYGNTLTGSCFVSSEQSSSAAGAVKMVIYDSSGTVLATGDAITLTQAWQRTSVQYNLVRGLPAASYRVGIVAAGTAWNMNTTPYYVDGFMFENRQDGISIGDYTDGAQAIDKGAVYEWDGAADASESIKRIGLSRVRGIRIKNDDGSNPIYLCIDTDASIANGIKIAAGETFETNWPIDAESKITAIATGGNVAVHGVIWGVHQN